MYVHCIHEKNCVYDVHVDTLYIHVSTWYIHVNTFNIIYNGIHEDTRYIHVIIICNMKISEYGSICTPSAGNRERGTDEHDQSC